MNKKCLMCKINSDAVKEFMKFLNWLSTKSYNDQIMAEYMIYEGKIK